MIMWSFQLFKEFPFLLLSSSSFLSLHLFNHLHLFSKVLLFLFFVVKSLLLNIFFKHFIFEHLVLILFFFQLLNPWIVYLNWVIVIWKSVFEVIYVLSDHMLFEFSVLQKIELFLGTLIKICLRSELQVDKSTHFALYSIEIHSFREAQEQLKNLVIVGDQV